MIIHKCDFCGKNFDHWDIQEGFGLHFPRVGYGSKYDEMSIEVDLCCDCFDKMMAEYVEPRLKFKDNAIKEYC